MAAEIIKEKRTIIYSVKLIGKAGTQGSKTAFVRNDALDRVAELADQQGGKVSQKDLREAIGKGQKGIALLEASSTGGDWRRALIIAMRLKGPENPMDEAVCVSFRIYVRRPRSHYKPNGDLRSNAPNRPKSGLDIDKVQRAIYDAGTHAGWWTNDARIAGIGDGSGRFYTEEGGLERTEIEAWSLEGERIPQPKKVRELPLFG